MHVLLNPTTGKEAMVTEKWMREGCVNGGPHWVRMKNLDNGATDA